MNASRDFNSISPSAKGLLMTKALTSIPFAKEAAAMVWGTEQLRESLKQKATRESFAWLLHFENRYRTIDSLLNSIAASNILEIASGFSFRGLQLCREKNIVYIDTDLPDSMNTKKQLVHDLIEQHHIQCKGKLLMEPLNALDEQAFVKVIELFPPGPVTIINEGLLMYLDDQEKRKLCANIYNVLKERGGSWITGDIYLKKKDDERFGVLREEAKQFLAAHQVEEKKFDSFEQAEQFFETCKFSIEKKEVVAYDQLSALRYIENEHIPADVIKSWFKTRETWRLVCA